MGVDEALKLVKSSSKSDRDRGYIRFGNVFAPEIATNPPPGMQEAIRKGFLEIAVDELANESGAYAECLDCLTHMALNDTVARDFANSGIFEPLCVIASRHAGEEVADVALNVMGSAALHPECHKLLKATGVLRVCLKTLRYLDSTDPIEISFGLGAVSVITRLFGNEEEGPGYEAIQGNQLIFTKTLEVLKLVIQGGESGVVYGYKRNPANIVLNLLVLSKSDANKKHLVPFIPLIVKVCNQRKSNERLQKFSVQTLSQLIFEPSAKPAMEKEEDDILDIVNHVIVKTRKTDPEVYKTASVLRATIEGGYQTGKQTVAPPPATSTKSGHVMISYQWDSQPIAKKLEQMLSQAGYKTWFDLNDMGANINDSMAEAVEGAEHIVVLFSGAYKESGNCRKELELADNMHKKIHFMKMDPDYNPGGWLALVMGKALWIGCFDEGMLHQAFDDLKKRLH